MNVKRLIWSHLLRIFEDSPNNSQSKKQSEKAIRYPDPRTFLTGIASDLGHWNYEVRPKNTQREYEPIRWFKLKKLSQENKTLQDDYRD